jgi:hypothetical protein
MRIALNEILLCILLVTVTSCLAAQDNPEAHFTRGKQLIEKNCGDCAGGSKNGLEEGINEVLKAIDLGYRDPKAAYKVLADAYSTMAIVFATPRSSEEKELFRRRKQMYEKLVSLDPADANTLFEYAKSLAATDDEETQLTALRNVLKLKPNHTGARFFVGVLLLRRGQASQAVTEIRKGLESAEGDDLNEYGPRAVQLFQQAARREDAEAIAQVVKQRQTALQKQNTPPRH